MGRMTFHISEEDLESIVQKGHESIKIPRYVDEVGTEVPFTHGGRNFVLRVHTSSHGTFWVDGEGVMVRDTTQLVCEYVPETGSQPAQ